MTIHEYIECSRLTGIRYVRYRTWYDTV